MGNIPQWAVMTVMAVMALYFGLELIALNRKSKKEVNMNLVELRRAYKHEKRTRKV
jgi:uncharacterized membrane protein